MSRFLASVIKMTAQLMFLCSVSVSHTVSGPLIWLNSSVCVCVRVGVCSDLFVHWSVRPCGCSFRVTAGVGLNGPVQEASLSQASAHSLSAPLLSLHYQVTTDRPLDAVWLWWAALCKNKGQSESEQESKDTCFFFFFLSGLLYLPSGIWIIFICR